MSIRVDVSSVQSQSSSVQKMCNAYIEEMENVKQEIAAFIMEVHLKGKTYTSAKSYFSSVYLPLADGIILLCEQMISAHEQFPQQYIERVDSNSLESEILQDQIEQLETLIEHFERFSESNIMIIDPFRESIEKCRETQQAIAGKLERLIEFDKSSATIFSDIQELLADVETGIEQVTSHKAWNETTETFHIKNWDLSWATRINEKKELGPNEVDHIQASSEEEQIKAFLNSGKEGTPFDPNDFEDPYDEPITVADKMEVLGGNSPLSGTPDGLAGPAMFAFNVGKGVGTGAYNIVDDTVEGLVTTVMHPIDTASSLGNAVLHPVNTYGIITDATNTSYDRDMRNGNAESRARWLTYASGTVLTSVVGTKGAGTVTKTGASTTKSTVQQVRNTTDSVMSNYVNPFGPELAVSHGVHVPHGVLNGPTLKDELLLFGKDFKSGENKTRIYNDNSMGHIFLGEINKRKNAVGYHHESMMGGKIIPGTKTPPDKNGVYMAKVEIKGVKKKPNSSFFPEHWDRVDVLKAVGEAFENKKHLGRGIYEGETRSEERRV